MSNTPDRTEKERVIACYDQKAICCTDLSRRSQDRAPLSPLDERRSTIHLALETGIEMELVAEITEAFDDSGPGEFGPPARVSGPDGVSRG